MTRPTDTPIDSTPVKATATSVHILEAIKAVEGATITELDDRLAFSKSTIYNHLETLEQLGFVVRDGWSYRISHRVAAFGAHARRQNPLFQHGQAEVRRLAGASGLDANIVVLEVGTAICIDVATGKNAASTLLTVGETLPLHCTAAGKALLSTFDDEDVETLIEETTMTQYTENTITSIEDLQRELTSIRSRGLAFDREEWQQDVRSIGTAITGIDGELLGAISIVGESDAMTGKRFQQDVPGLVISSANAIRNSIQAEP